ncbi:unnamed protein product, partial [Rotaria sp. Silwood2]
LAVTDFGSIERVLTDQRAL